MSTKHLKISGDLSLPIDAATQTFAFIARKGAGKTYADGKLRKKGERHPVPVHLMIEESQLIVPENFGGDSARMVGIYEEIIRLGRNYGIGVSMISQRPQSVNKEVLNQTECLLVGQVNGAHE